MGGLATQPLPSTGSPPLQSGGQNQQWPTNGRIGYITCTKKGSPTLQSGQIGYMTPAVYFFTNASQRKTKSQNAHK